MSLAKRLVDLVIAVPVFVALIPLLIVLAILIKLDSRGPILYRCARVGLKGREFSMFKFRKMHRDAAGLALTSASDERFTRFGRFLARRKLDELPQLWNVICGDMSLVGSRPEDPSFVALHPQQYAEILRARPGITGLSQLAFAREGNLLDGPDPLGRYVESLLPQKIAIDRLYVASRSISMDLRILAWTVAAVFGTEVAVNRRTGRLTIRRRPQATAASSQLERARR